MKYPRTPHLSYSLGRSPDDISFEGTFRGEVVVTEKMDGECTTMTKSVHHARSLDSGRHPSRSKLGRLWGEIRHEIPDGLRVVGENVSAIHSIEYARLPDIFLVFACVQDGLFLSWDETVAWVKLLGLETVPVLYRGSWPVEHSRLFTGSSVFGGPQEGYVVRSVGMFPVEDFGLNVAKFVRQDHVQTDQHWMFQPVRWQRISHG